MVTKTVFRIVKAPSSGWASAAAQKTSIDESLSTSLPPPRTGGAMAMATAEPARSSANNSSHHVVSSDDNTSNTCDAESINANALDTNSKTKKRPLISEKTANKRQRFKIDLTGVPPLPPIRRASGSGKRTSKYQGVSYCNSKKRWRAQISINGVVRGIGRYINEEVIDGKRYIVVRCDDIEEDENASHYVRAESSQEAGTGNVTNETTLPVHTNAKESVACYRELSQFTYPPVPNRLSEDAPPPNTNERIMNSGVCRPSVFDAQRQQQ